VSLPADPQVLSECRQPAAFRKPLKNSLRIVNVILAADGAFTRNGE
jgi:hypothetical protein